MLYVVLRKKISGKASQRVAFGVNVEGGESEGGQYSRKKA